MPDWDAVKRNFDQAIGLRSSERAAFLAKSCGDDAALLDEVNELLAAHVEVSGLLASTCGEAAPAEARFAQGTVIEDRYELQEVLGSGATGTVYSGHDRLAARPVAVKVLRPLGERGLRDVRREITTLRLLRLPGVLQLLDDGSVGDHAFIVTELVNGSPFPGEPVPRSWPQIRETCLRLCETLQRLHCAGVIHRDIKPNNVFVGADGKPTLLDLGISAGPSVHDSPLDSEVVAGTPLYSAPEQLAGSASTQLADVYSLGVLLYFSLAGCLPHEADSLMSLIVAKLEQAPVDLESLAPETPPEVRSVIHAMISADPKCRPASMAEVGERLAGEEQAPLVPVPETVRRRGRFTLVELQDLFTGSDRVHHLPTDAASELLVRTEGEPASVETEIRSWVRSGLAYPSEDGVRITRTALEFLSGGLGSDGGRDAHDEVSRLLELARADRLSEMPAAAAQAARQMIGVGRVERGAMLIVEGLAAVRRSGRADGEEELLELLLESALSSGTTDSIDRALYHIQRSISASGSVPMLERIARAALLTLEGDLERALNMLNDIGHHDAEVDRLGYSVKVLAARYLSLDRERQVVSEAMDWAELAGTDAARATAWRWEAWLRYGEGDFEGATRLHLRASTKARGHSARISALLNAATSALDGFEFREAEELARRARALAADCRHANHEARAECMLRDAAYRRGVATAPDLELIDALRSHGVAYLEALICLTEGSVAWRAGDQQTGRSLATRALEIWRSSGQTWTALLAEALWLACGGRTDAARPREMLDEVEECPIPGVKLQVMGLVSLACGGGDGTRIEDATGTAARLPRELWPLRREVVSIGESLGWIGANAH